MTCLLPSYIEIFYFPCRQVFAVLKGGSVTLYIDNFVNLRLFCDYHLKIKPISTRPAFKWRVVMSERTKLLKKAVMTGVGGATNVDRIKSAITEAMNDLVKVSQDLLDDLEEKGTNKTDSVQQFIKNLKSETEKKGFEVEKKVSSNVKGSMKKAAKELGLITREDWEELYERIAAIEDAVGVAAGDEESEGKKSRKKKSNNN